MAAPEQERWLGPVWRDGRWWVVREDGDQVGWADDVRWHPGWPPGRFGGRPFHALLALLLTLPFLVAGALVVTGQLCAFPECGFGELIAIQKPQGDGLPVVYAAPCARTPVEQVTVSRLSSSGAVVEEVWRLERQPGGGRTGGGTVAGVVTRFPLGEPVPGYREAAGRSPDVLRAAYRARLRTPPVMHQVTLTYADGSSDRAMLGYASDIPGLDLHTWGDPTLEQFAADASVTGVCLPWIQEPQNALPLSTLGWLLAGLLLAVRAARRGVVAQALLRQAAGQVPQGTARSGS